MSNRFWDSNGNPRVMTTVSISCATDDELSVMFTNMKFTKQHRLNILREITKRLAKLHR